MERPQVTSRGNTLDREGAHALLDAISPDRPGLIFGKPYGLLTFNGKLRAEMNPGFGEWTEAQRTLIAAELEKARQLPEPPIRKSQIELLEERIKALEDRV